MDLVPTFPFRNLISKTQLFLGVDDRHESKDTRKYKTYLTINEDKNVSTHWLSSFLFTQKIEFFNEERFIFRKKGSERLRRRSIPLSTHWTRDPLQDYGGCPLGFAGGPLGVL